MSPRIRAALLRCYPADWRSRYGAELSAMIETESTGGGALRIALDLIRGAGRERLREFGMRSEGDPAPARASSGVLLVLCSWALLVLGGAGLQRFSEHWEGLTPASALPLPHAAFAALVISGSLGCLLVGAGILMALPRLVDFLRGGGWPAVRRGALQASGATVLMIAMTAGLAVWAHHLTDVQRNGGEAGYTLAFLAWAVFAAGTLLAWTFLAARCARHIGLAGGLLVMESALAVGVAFSAVAATAAAAVWWGSLAARAPAVLHGNPGGGGSAIALPLLADTGAMALGALLACVGGRRCAGELARLARR